MDLKEYEETIYYYLTWLYPDAEILYNQNVVGNITKSSRQVDILIDTLIAGQQTRVIIDSKSYMDAEIDEQSVKAFSDLLADCKAQQGLLITTKGVTESAITTAQYDSKKDLEIDILNFEAIKQSEGVGVIVQYGNYSALITAPFGWIIDSERNNPDFLAAIYQRGHTLTSASDTSEWMYVHIIPKSESVKTLDALLSHQEKFIKSNHPDSRIEYDTRNFDKPHKIMFREITDKNKSQRAITGYIEFDDFIFYSVLITPQELYNKNIRKLEYVINRIMPGGLMYTD